MYQSRDKWGYSQVLSEEEIAEERAREQERREAEARRLAEIERKNKAAIAKRRADNKVFDPRDPSLNESEPATVNGNADQSEYAVQFANTYVNEGYDETDPPNVAPASALETSEYDLPPGVQVVSEADHLAANERFDRLTAMQDARDDAKLAAAEKLEKRKVAVKKGVETKKKNRLIGLIDISGVYFSPFNSSTITFFALFLLSPR